MKARLFIGNLSPETNEQDLMDILNCIGRVKWVRLIKDKETRRSRGFGFAEMEKDTDALIALNKLNGEEWKARKMTVRAAQPYHFKK